MQLIIRDSRTHKNVCFQTITQLIVKSKEAVGINQLDNGIIVVSMLTDWKMKRQCPTTIVIEDLNEGDK